MASTVTPLAIIESAICAILSASSCAFWMSYLTPASLNAASRAGRSAVSQRTEDSVSGRITPILASAALSLPLPLLPLSSLLLPQALRPSERPSAPATSTAGIRFTQIASFFVRGHRPHRRVTAVGQGGK